MTCIHIRSVLVLTLLLSVLPTLTQGQSYKTWSEVDLYTHGKDKVLKGRDLESAITLLSALVARKPGDADYQMMLGSACVSRLASLHCAAEDSKIIEGARRSYQKRLKIWQQMQEDSALPLFGKPQPVAPADPNTPDNGKTYDPQDPTTQKQMTDLSLLSLHSFHEAIRLGRSLAPKHKTQVDYSCGWGLLLLYRSAKESIKYQEAPTPTKTESVPLLTQADQEDKILTHEEIIACFQACADADSKNAGYWQSLAFAYAPDYLTDVITSFDAKNLAQSNANKIEDALRCLQRALTLKRADPDLLYQAALLSSVSLPDKALNYLQKLTGIQNANAVNFYLLAEACFKQAEHLVGSQALQAKQDALAAIESGNQAPQYYNAEMILPLPKLLTAAWTYHRTYGLGLDSRCLDSLFGFLYSTASDATEHKEGDFLMRCGVAMMNMGLTALRHYDGTDLDPMDLRTNVILYDRAFQGMVSCGKGYKLIQTAAVMSPSPVNISAADEYAQSAAYWRAWDTALIQK